jgi:hypothetical protein
MTEKAKDPMTKFRSVIRGKNSKGGDRFQLYLTTEEATALVATITANLANPKGVKLDLHVSKKEFEGRTFDSAIAFVKAVSEGPGGSFGGNKTFVAKAQPTTADMQARIEALKAQQVK